MPLGADKPNLFPFADNEFHRLSEIRVIADQHSDIVIVFVAVIYHCRCEINV